MNSVIFLEVDFVCEVQSSILKNAPSRDKGMVDSALNRVLNKFTYEGVNDLFQLAAMYLISLSKAHAFPDANKRTDFMSTFIFLKMNGVCLQNDFEQLIEITLDAASKNMSYVEIAERLHSLKEM